MVQIPNAPRVGDMATNEPIPEAKYTFRVSKAEYKVSKEKKTPMVEITLTVTGPADAEEYVGRKVFENLMLAGEGTFRTRQLLTAAGKSEDFVLEDTEQLIDMEIAGIVQTEKERVDPATGQTYPARNKVAKFEAI